METEKRILLEALITEREGMIAENHQRLHLGQSMAYGDEAFTALAAQVRELISKTETNQAKRKHIKFNLDFIPIIEKPMPVNKLFLVLFEMGNNIDFDFAVIKAGASSGESFKVWNPTGNWYYDDEEYKVTHWAKIPDDSVLGGN